jgi:alkylated DNA repair dioxygenase AlkB
MTKKFKNMNMKEAEVWYCPDFFSIEEQQSWYELIDTSVSWETFQIMMYGKKIDQPRESFYMAEKDYPYKYSGLDRKPAKWTVSVIEMKYILDKEINKVQPGHQKLNGCLGNKYNDGNNYIGAHSDNEADLNPDAFIVSVSLGSPRDFIFTHKVTKEKVKIILKPGSVLLMGKGCQENWKHEVPKRLKITKPRINLTFRSVFSRNTHILHIYSRDLEDESEPTITLVSKSLPGLKKKYIDYLTKHRNDDDYLEDDMWEKCVENYVKDIEKSECPELNCVYRTEYSLVI